MAVHDVSTLLDLSRPAAEPNPLIAAPPQDGSRYLDALKRSVKLKPAVQPRPDAETPRTATPSSRDRRDTQEHSLTDDADSQPPAGVRETKPSRNDQPSPSNQSHIEETAQNQPTTDRRSEPTVETNRPATSNAEPSSGPVIDIPSIEIQHDRAAPPPAHIVELFGDLTGSVDALHPSAIATDGQTEPTPPAGLAGVLIDGVTTANRDGGETGPTPGAYQGIVDVTSNESPVNANVESLQFESPPTPAIAGNVVAETVTNPIINPTITPTTETAGDGDGEQSTNTESASNGFGTKLGAAASTPLAGVAVLKPIAPATAPTGAAGIVETTLASPTIANSGLGGLSAATTPAAESVGTIEALTPNSTTNVAAANSDAKSGNAGPSPAGEVEATDRGRFAQRVVQAVRNAVAGNRSFRVVLHPPELGTLQVEIATDANGKLTATLEVQTQAAQQALREHLGDLRSSLGRQGVTLDRIEIQVAESSPGEDRGFHEQHPESRQETFADDHSPREEPVSRDSNEIEEEADAAPHQASRPTGARRTIDDVIDVQV